MIRVPDLTSQVGEPEVSCFVKQGDVEGHVEAVDLRLEQGHVGSALVVQNMPKHDHNVVDKGNAVVSKESIDNIGNAD